MCAVLSEITVSKYINQKNQWYRLHKYEFAEQLKMRRSLSGITVKI